MTFYPEKMSAWASKATVLGPELGSLANDARSAPGAEVDITTNREGFGTLELSVNFTSAPTASNPGVEIWAVSALDGTNYEDGSASVPPASACLVDIISVRAVTGAQRRRGRRKFDLDPSKTKFLAVNKTGVAFPSSGSSIVLYTSSRGIES